MKKGAFIFAVSLPVFFIIIGFPGCVKDKCRNTYSYTYYKPVYQTTQEVRANVKSNAPTETVNPGKIYVFGKYIFLGEVDKGVHVIDNSNPSAPRNVAFIDIPGNGDIAVKGNTLYADMFTDLVAIDITNPESAVLKNVVEGVFPERIYGGGFSMTGSMVVTDWVAVDTTVTIDCYEGGGLYFDAGPQAFYLSSSTTPGTASNAGSSVSPVGKGGSMARFTIVNDRLYTVSSTVLSVFNITSSDEPHFVTESRLNWGGVETIYSFKQRLFIGTQSGMYIYNISNGDNPYEQGKFGHVQSCDPVIADDNYAYVTLRSGTACQGFTNEMDVLELNDITNPDLKKVYPMSNPHGLSKDGNTLFVCDGEAGLKVYDASDVLNMKLINTIEGINTYDIIAFNKLALVVAKDGLYQFDYNNLANIRQLSKLNVLQK